MRLKDTRGAWDRRQSWSGKYKNNYIIISESRGQFFWYFEKSDMSYSSLWENLTFQTTEDASEHAKQWINAKLKEKKRK